ncbi:MAG: hypothetical protein PVI88_00395 [Nitrosopumilaceae archaeon]|jgi:DNA polymerase III sliding clamp (beta) subunit (PCNA family)
MEIKTDELKNVLNTLFAYVSKKNNIVSDVFSKFIFDNDKIFIVNEEYAFEIPFDIDLSAVLGVDEMIKIINGISAEKINMKIKDDFLLIKSGNTKAKIICNEVKEENKKFIDVNYKWKKVPDNFNMGVGLCIFSAAKDDYMYVYNNIHIHDNMITSTDNLRISKFLLEEKMDEFLLPLISAKFLCKHKTKKYFLEKNMVHFKNDDGTIFHSRIVSGDFPDINQFFILDKKNIFYTFPDDIKNTIKLVSTLAEGEFDVDKRIEIKIQNNSMKCKAKNTKGWIESDIKLDIGIDFEFKINPVFLLDILNLSMKFTIIDDRFIFISDNFFHSFMVDLMEGK